MEEKAAVLFGRRKRALAPLQETLGGQVVKELGSREYIHLLEQVKMAHLIIEDLGGVKMREGVPLVKARTSGDEWILGTRERCDIRKLLFYLEDYFVNPSVYRSIKGFGENHEYEKYLKTKLDMVLRTGFDKPLSETVWLSKYPSKVLEYGEGRLPRLITAYEAGAVRHLEGQGEGHEWQFKIPPKEALQFVLWVEQAREQGKC